MTEAAKKSSPWASYQCLKCEDIIKSSYSGEYVTCKCGRISVDQTRYYTRFIGKPSLFKEIKND